MGSKFRFVTMLSIRCLSRVNPATDALAPRNKTSRKYCFRLKKIHSITSSTKLGTLNYWLLITRLVWKKKMLSMILFCISIVSGRSSQKHPENLVPSSRYGNPCWTRSPQWPNEEAGWPWHKLVRLAFSCIQLRMRKCLLNMGCQSILHSLRRSTKQNLLQDDEISSD